MSASIAGVYFDGRSSKKHAVELDLSSGLLALRGAVDCVYTSAQARLSEPFGDAPCVINFDDGARLEVPRAALPQLKDALRYRHSLVERWQHRWRSAATAVALMAGAVAGFAIWGVPLLSEQVVAAMPVAVDRQAGEHALKSLDGRVFKPTKLSKETVAQVTALFVQIRPAQTRLPLDFRVMDMPGEMPNAIALPNGTIIMTDEMVRLVQGKANSLDPTMQAKLAGVMAHEIGHVEGRHGMRTMVRGSLIGLGAATLFGDFSAVVAGVPTMLLQLDYSRSMERAADDYAIARLQQLGMSTAPLADLFEAMEKRMGKHSGSDYFSTHPATAERVARFRQAGR